MAYITGTGQLVCAGSNEKVMDCQFDNTNIYLNGATGTQILRCLFTSGPGIINNGSQQVLVADNTFQGTEAVDGGLTTNEGWVITDNLVSSTDGFVGLTASEIQVTGNTMSVTGKAIELVDHAGVAGGAQVLVADNVIDGGTIYIAGVNGEGAQAGCSVHDNLILEPGGHGIRLVDCDYATVHHNTVTSIFPDAVNTYDGILVELGARVTVDHNKIVGEIEGQGADLRYGVNIASGLCHIVVGNDLGSVSHYATDAINDAGALTSLTYPNDAIYGDNFTECGGS